MRGKSALRAARARRQLTAHARPQIVETLDELYTDMLGELATGDYACFTDTEGNWRWRTKPKKDDVSNIWSIIIILFGVFAKQGGMGYVGDGKWVPVAIYLPRGALAGRTPTEASACYFCSVCPENVHVAVTMT